MSKKIGKNKIAIALSGAQGRMGHEIQQLLPDSGLVLAWAINSSTDWRKCSPENVDLVIDFSNPKGMQSSLSWAVGQQKPFVSGTTGLSAKDRKSLSQAAKKIPVLYSANMSLGVAVLGEMLKALRAVRDWDFQIEEAHHAQKKDRPSGTALLLQDQLTEVVGRKLPLPNSIRGGGIPGIHEIWAMGPEESLVLHHTAFHRKVFARGAIQAARWLFDKNQAGLYDLSNLYQTTKS